VARVLAIFEEKKNSNGGDWKMQCLKGRYPRGGVSWKSLLLLISLFAVQGSCGEGGGGTITITAEEFRFTPKRIQWTAGRPLRLLLRNQGRERHVFHSPELFEKGKSLEWVGGMVAVQQNNAVMLEPGQSIELKVELLPGLYPFRCWIKGHAGMEGVIVVNGMGSQT
jgi:uncharacterized cupredoxin-like copper-binding protein